MMLMNELMKKIEEKNKQLLERETTKTKKIKHKKNEKRLSKKISDGENEVGVEKDKSGNIIIHRHNGTYIISTYDLYMMRKQVEEAEKDFKEILDRLREKKDIKNYIAYKFGAVLDPTTMERFEFPYISRDDEDFAYKYGRVIMDILHGDVETLERILNFD